ncbi:GDNF-inducible zinc finger protein 1 [Larimichthys crocea]|uniref:Uncharacterized protein n=1 Tax=Larimichthys crocea TaxID=215358 RepID=A0ACD3QZ25_LARCR|nr:GDNF-inducible zinc finger protein 1 [Larimichthys crocea]
MPVSDVDDWEGEEDEQSNDPEDSLLLSLEEKEEKKEEEEEEEEEEDEDGQSKETLKKTYKAQFQCNKCQRTFHYERSYMKHISTYHGVKADVIYRCETCSQTFANRSNLKIHEKHVHSTERLFTCDSCTKTYTNVTICDMSVLSAERRSAPKPHCCCMRGHTQVQSLMSVPTVGPDLPKTLLSRCTAGLTQERSQFACDKCEARFTQKHMLAYHKRSHTGEKPFMCEACGKSFASKEYLRHHSNIHTGSRPYKCEQCGRGFAQRNSLHQHLKIHTGERPYSCKDCDKQFTQLNALQRHQRIHTGEKPYMCGLCRRTFTDKSTLRRHTMIHDSDAPWKTYLVVLEGNVEDKKPKTPTKGKTEKAGCGREKEHHEKKRHWCWYCWQSQYNPHRLHCGAG